jgi:hypothetical protein
MDTERGLLKMPVKYECPKCGRRFTEWGAEKVGFKCPRDQWCTKDHPEDVELVRVGSSDEGMSRRPTLKRTPRKIAQPKQAAVELDEDEALVPDMEEIEAEDEFDDDEEEEEGVVIEEDDETEGDAPDTDSVSDDEDDEDEELEIEETEEVLEEEEID